jgi:hypothetical protein
MATTTTSLSQSHSAPAATWIRAGLVGGAVAGMAFALFEMLAAALLNGPDAFFMPLRMIGGIALGMSALDPSTPLAAAGAIGLVLHMALSMMYGTVVAGLIAASPSIARSASSVLAVASAAGFGLWVINFFVLARVFGWAWFPDGQNVAVQAIAHTMMFGTVLGLVLNRMAFRTAG